MPPQPDNSTQTDLARELRAAVLGSDHALAAHLSEQYTRALARQWELLSESERASSDIPKRSSELLTWAREMTIMQHAMAGQHLAAIGMAHRYLAARSNYAQSASLEG